MHTAKHPAAFINIIAEEGTKEEAVKYLQQTWDDLWTLRDALSKLGFDNEQLNRMQETGSLGKVF